MSAVFKKNKIKNTANYIIYILLNRMQFNIFYLRQKKKTWKEAHYILGVSLK